MEILGAIIVIVLFNLLLRGFFTGARVAAAGAKAAVTGKEFDLNAALGRIPPFDARIMSKNTETDGSGLEYYAIEVMGLIPTAVARELTVAVSLFDVTDGKDKPAMVLSLVDRAREPHSPVFFQRADLGLIQPNQGFTKWVEVGRIFPLFVQPPKSGRRTIETLVRVIPTAEVHDIKYGFQSGKYDKPLWGKAIDKEFNFIASGYEEAFENRKESMALGVKLAMSVAMSDGTIADDEGHAIKHWMEFKAMSVSEKSQPELKEKLNAAMKEAHAELTSGKFSNSQIISKINAITEMPEKYEIMELCYDVMAADGVADPEELKILHRIGEALELDTKELERIRDTRMVSLTSALENDASSESLLGMDPSWDDLKKQNYLKAEFKKWNARLNNVSNDADREHAQKMLDLIGEERKKYG